MCHAVFVGHEGVILRTRGDAREAGHLSLFLPGAIEALTSLVRAGLYIMVIAPRSRPNRRFATGQTPDENYACIAEAVGGDRGQIDCVHCATVSAEQAGAWRDSSVELIWTAARQRGIEPSTSYLVGNTVSEMEVGRTMGCRERYLVLTGRGRHELARCRLRGERGLHVAFDLRAAAADILLQEQSLAMASAPATLREMAT